VTRLAVATAMFTFAVVALVQCDPTVAMPVGTDTPSSTSVVVEVGPPPTLPRIPHEVPDYTTTTQAPVPPVVVVASSRSCPQWEPMLTLYSPGWDVQRMSRIMWRESRCKPWVRNSCCVGLLQIHEGHRGEIMRKLGIPWKRIDLTDPDINIRAAAMLWAESKYRPWHSTDRGN